MITLLWATLAFAVAAVVLLVITLAKLAGMAGEAAMRRREMDDLHREFSESQRALRAELGETVQRSVRSMGSLLMDNQTALGRAQGEKLAEIQRGLLGMSAQMENRLKTSALENEQKLENIRGTMEQRLGALQTDNNKRLDEMRQVVDEKLQKTLDERMTQSFKLVNERLEQVYKGLGEMQSLAVGVGDLKKVLSNVKTRGTLGEIQLEAILTEILTPEQYEKNALTSPRGRERVEFAIRLPGDDAGHVLLPIDSKFPMDAYGDLMDAYDAGDPGRVKACQEALKTRMRGFAKDIRDKYIDPPHTTEFGIMFLPTEGLYAEAVRLGLIERLQAEYRVNIAGPSTMAALLNSLQMGFRSVAIQRRSGEVWKVLSAVKTEFDRFHEVLSRTQKQLTRANNELDTLIGVRTRRIQSRLKTVTAMPASEVPLYLPEDTVEITTQDDYTDEEE
ncbi:MAG: DNA recombination protein RmuC [Candidatus Pelethousia sp.]|nr:DNA recombination protein RmuC [Candidatus Pelethousia sp.]